MKIIVEANAFIMVFIFQAQIPSVVILRGEKMELEIILIFAAIIVFGGIIVAYLYFAIATTNQFVFELSDLVSRTFREYYKGENIEPVMVNNGVDLIWNESSDPVKENARGFITILTEDANVDSPIKDYKEADIIAGKISKVVNDYIQDREIKNK